MTARESQPTPVLLRRDKNNAFWDAALQRAGQSTHRGQ